MQGNHVVVLSSLIASEMAVHNAFQAALQAPNPWVVMAIVVLAVFAVAHQTRLVLEVAGHGFERSEPAHSWLRTRRLLASLLRLALKHVQPPKPTPRPRRQAARRGGDYRAR